jgi:hypothetical protein
MEFNDSVGVLTDSETYMMAGAAGAGYMGAGIAKNVIDSRFDAPDEVYGLVVIALAEMTGAAGYKMAVQAGAGAHTAEAAADRLNVRDTIASLGA